MYIVAGKLFRRVFDLRAKDAQHIHFKLHHSLAGLVPVVRGAHYLLMITLLVHNLPKAFVTNADYGYVSG